ncbi:hypothetical protein GCM10009663_16300 [Kitasatospora arboriphila]|uniref:Uncharacterized protein n=1 Tax=Kitasatospora arboriphila TaxID=258052 RepID=A0ABN1TEB7_9ACTN
MRPAIPDESVTDSDTGGVAMVDVRRTGRAVTDPFRVDTGSVNYPAKRARTCDDPRRGGERGSSIHGPTRGGGAGPG